MRILIVAPEHNYDNVRVFQKEAVSLVGFGHDVSLLSNIDYSETVNGVKVFPVPKFKSRFKRFINLPSIAITALRFEADVYHLHNPDTLPLAIFLKLFGKKVIYDVHEDFAKRILVREWIPSVIRPLIAFLVTFLEKIVSLYVDKVITTEISVKKRLGDKPIIIENAPIIDGILIDDAIERSRAIIHDASTMRVVFVGYISGIRGVFNMVDAIYEANKKCRCRFSLIGPFVSQSEFAEVSKRPGWKYVDYFGELPQSEAFSHMIASDVGLLLYQNVAGQASANPNKLFEYQSFGLPFVASNFENYKKYQGNKPSGIFVDETNVKDIAKAIQLLLMDDSLRKKYGNAGKEFCSGYNWQEESLKLKELYESLASK